MIDRSLTFTNKDKDVNTLESVSFKIEVNEEDDMTLFDPEMWQKNQPGVKWVKAYDGDY